MKKRILLGLFLCVSACAYGASTPSFVKKHESQKVKKEKNVEKKVIELARSLFDTCADLTIQLTQWSKRLSETVFTTLEEGNKKELNQLLADLKRCEKELLEIQKKIDTL